MLLLFFFQKIQSAWNFLIKKGIPNTYCNYFDSASSTDKLKMRDVLVGGISIALAASSCCWEVMQTYTLTLKSPLRCISVVLLEENTKKFLVITQKKTEIFVLIMLLLLSPFACSVFLYDELLKKPNFIPKLALPSTREKMTFSSTNDTLLSAKI